MPSSLSDGGCDVHHQLGFDTVEGVVAERHSRDREGLPERLLGNVSLVTALPLAEAPSGHEHVLRLILTDHDDAGRPVSENECDPRGPAWR